MSGPELARLFHETYEELAPQFGYETRQETRAFDPESPNGKLMVATCESVLTAWNQREAPQGWQPIETAPRDGTAIILAASHGVSVGWWEDSEPTFKWRFVDDFDLTPTGCCDDESDDRVPCNGMHADTPTHWQPLPTPPEKL